MASSEVKTVVRLRATDVRDLFPSLAPTDAGSRVCLLCASTLKDKTHNLTRHLERHHAAALHQLLEQKRTIAAPVLLTSGAKAADTKKRARATEKGRSSSSVRVGRSSSKLQRGTTESRAKTSGPSDHGHSDTDSDDTVAAAAAKEEEQTQRVENAKRAIVHWLSREQLPIALVESDGFRAFTRALNDRFSAIARDDVVTLLTATPPLAGDTKSEQPTQQQPRRGVVTRALVASSRTSTDVCTVQYQQLLCGGPMLSSGYALVRVRAAIATHWDAQACRGLVCGRRGVLGRAFVGVVERTQPASEGGGCSSIRDQQRVVLASPCFLAAEPTTPGAQFFGVDAAAGALSEYVALPLASLVALPTSVPDDLALLASDAALALRIARELQQRNAQRVAIVLDGVAGSVAVLLARYVRQELQVRDVRVVMAPGASVELRLQTLVQPFAALETLNEYKSASGSAGTGLELFVVDLCGTDASTELAVHMTAPMGTLVLVARERFEGTTTSTASRMLAVDMNAVVVNELEVVAVGDCAEETVAAVAYLASQANKSDGSALELRALLTAPMALDGVLNELRSLPLDALETQHVQVTVSTDP